MDHGVKSVRAVAGVALAALALAVSAAPAAAQVSGLPVYNAGVPRGIGLSADLGFPNEDAGKGMAYGVSASAGIGLIGVTATLAALNPDGPAGSAATYGGTVNYRVFGGPLVPLSVTLQGGVGYHKPEVAGQEVTDVHVPIGVGFALTIPNPALAIKPWLAPRVDIVHHKVEGPLTTTTSTNTEFGLSGGVEFNFLGGFGVHAAYDLLMSGSNKPGVLGIGAHYALKVPGL